MKTRILIVDDDIEYQEAIQMGLEVSGYEVLKAENGIQGLQILEEQIVHLILSDVAMPVMNGYQFFDQVCQHPQWKYIPFLFLSARDLDSDVRYGKELGADDYLIKPVHRADLLATIRGKLKHAKRRQTLSENKTIEKEVQIDPEILSYGVLKINFAQHRVWMADEQVQLSTLEFRLLRYLVRRPGRVITHQALIKATHKLDTDPQDASRLLRPLVRSLRRKLGYQKGDMGCIESIRGVGYQFNEHNITRS